MKKETQLIEHLQKLSAHLKICPNFDFQQNKLRKNSITSIITSFSIILMVILLTASYFWGSSLIFMSQHLIFVKASRVAATIMIIDSIIGCFTNKKYWNKLFLAYSELPKLKETHFSKYINVYFLIYLIINISIWSFSYLTDMIILSLDPIILIICLLADTIHMIHFNSVKFVMILYFYDLKCRFNNLELIIKNLKPNKPDLGAIIRNLEMEIWKTNLISRLLTKIFGSQCLFTILYGFFIGIEFCCNQYEYPIFGVYLILYIATLAPIIACIYSGDLTNRAVNRVPYQLNKISNYFKKDTEEIQERIQDLAFRAELLLTNISAARFFKINRLLAFTLLLSIGNYFVVIVSIFSLRGRT